MNSLFGVELPTPVNFVIAFVVVLGLIGLATWAVRRFGSARLDAAARGRQPRLAVVDSASVDGRRKLVIIRRDNVEHLLMIGGPTDVVVETAIVRASAAPARETPARNAAADTLPRAIPLPDPTPWPLAPEPTPAPAPAAAPVLRAERRDEVAQWPFQAAPAPAAPRAAAQAEPAAVFAEPTARPAPARPPAAAAQTDVPANADQNLAEMAQRLEAALRRPAPNAAPVKPVAPEPKREEPPKARANPAPATAKVAQPAPAQQPAAASGKFDSLEQEMASLLGRPTTGKT